MVELHHYAKFNGDWLIFEFLKTAAAAILDFEILNF